MIIKRFVYKSGVKFKRVWYNRGNYLCSQYKCKYRYGDTRSNNPICELCRYIRNKFSLNKFGFSSNLYIPDVS